MSVIQMGLWGYWKVSISGLYLISLHELTDKLNPDVYCELFLWSEIQINKDALKPTSIWVFYREHISRCPTTMGDSACCIHIFRWLMPCSIYWWGKYIPNKSIGRYHSCSVKFLLAPIYGRASCHSGFDILSPCGIYIVAPRIIYAVDLQIPLLVIFLISCLVIPKLYNFFLHVSDILISTSAWFLWTRQGLYKFPPYVLLLIKQSVLLVIFLLVCTSTL